MVELSESAGSGSISFPPSMVPSPSRAVVRRLLRLRSATELSPKPAKSQPKSRKPKGLTRWRTMDPHAHSTLPSTTPIAPPRLTFESQVYDLIRAHQVPHEVHVARQTLITQLTQHLRQHIPQFQVDVELFGSSRTGLSNSFSDLDLCIIDPTRPRGFENAKEKKNQDLPVCYNIKELANVLRKSPLFKSVQAINAGVPICKFSAVINGFMFAGDLNCNERFGVYNSDMLRTYLNINAELFKPVAIFIKHWAKCRGLNDPAGNNGITTLSSYSLILLLIGYFQTINVLPNLQDPFLLSLREPRMFFSSPKSSHGENVAFNTDFLPNPPSYWAGKTMSIKDAILGFFDFYSGRGFDTTSQVLSISSGGPRMRRIPFGLSLKKQRVNIGSISQVTQGEPKPEAVAESGEGGQVQNEELSNTTGTSSIEPRKEKAPLDQFPDSEAYETQNDGWRNDKLVIQDPFILTRNTAQNIQPRVVDVIVQEFSRAADLIRCSAPLEWVCTSQFHDPVKWPTIVLQGAEKQRAWREREKRQALMADKGWTRRGKVSGSRRGG